MLIVLEGLDGAGKSTQLKMVTSYLSSLGRTVEYQHFPRYDAPVYGELIGKFLRGDFGAIDQDQQTYSLSGSRLPVCFSLSVWVP